jgi:hypothetical protein
MISSGTLVSSYHKNFDIGFNEIFDAALNIILKLIFNTSNSNHFITFFYLGTCI